MASTNLLRTTEALFTFALLLSAVCAFVLWHEPACGVILVYLAIRIVLFGMFVGA